MSGLGWGAQFVMGGGLVALMGALLLWFRFPREARKLDAQRDEIMQDLGRKNTEAATKVVGLVSDQMDEMNAALEEMKAERAKLRDRALAAEAAEAKAKAEHAQAVADLAVEKALRSQERHDMRNELTARDTRIAALENEVGELRSQLTTFLAQHGLLDRRQSP